MKNKQLIELDFDGMLQDIRNKKVSVLEVAEFIVQAMNAGCDFKKEYPLFETLRDLHLATGSVEKRGDMYYFKPEVFFHQQISPDDLKGVKGFKVCESKEEWGEFKEDQQKKAKQRQVEQKLRERYQARHSKPRV